MWRQKKYGSFVSVLVYGILVFWFMLGLFAIFYPIRVIAEFIRLFLTLITGFIVILFFKIVWGYSHDALGRPRVGGSLAPRYIDPLVKIFLTLMILFSAWLFWSRVSLPIALWIAAYLKSIGVPLTVSAILALTGIIIIEYRKK